MTTNEKDRVLIYRRMIIDSKKDSILNSFKDNSDEDLLEILNTTILPNSMSFENLKYTLLFNLINNSGKAGLKRVKNQFNKIISLFEVLDRAEKDLLKFGIFNGFYVYNWKYHMERYIKTSSDPSMGELMYKKNISTYTFKRIFPFIYSIIQRGEKNERFPRV